MTGTLAINVNNSFHYLFEPSPPIIEEGFPSFINLGDLDIFTQETFKEQFLQAQSNGLPYYLISIAELVSPKDSKRIYKFYATASLRAHEFDCYYSAKDFICPATKLKIDKVHYFAIDCFKVQKSLTKPNEIQFIPKEIDEIKQCKYFFPTIFESSGNKELVLDALNQNIGVECQKEFQLLKRKQKLISSECKSLYIDYLGKNSLSGMRDQQKAKAESRLVSPKSRTYIKQRLKILKKQIDIEEKKWDFCSEIKAPLSIQHGISKSGPY
jgi:hypothetical protein